MRFGLACLLGVATLALFACAAAGDPAVTTPQSPAGTAVAAPAAPAPDLDKAIAALRRIDPATIGQRPDDPRRKELSAAMDALVKAGKGGAERLKQEIHRAATAGEPVGFFQISATELLWQIGKLDEAQSIADIWKDFPSFGAHYETVASLAFEAAQTRDPRALALMVAVLRDKKGHALSPDPTMKEPLVWPTTARVVWGVYGPQALPALERLLDETPDETTLETAVQLLADAQYLPALARIRRLAREGIGAPRQASIGALGYYGHPQDFDFLAEGLKENPTVAVLFVTAFAEYEDLRAVRRLIPLLGSSDSDLRTRVIKALAGLPCAASLEAMRSYSQMPPMIETMRKAEVVGCATFLQTLLKTVDATPPAYAAMSPQDRDRVGASVLRAEQEKGQLKGGDRRLTHEEFLKVAADWKAKRRLAEGEYAWVRPAHVAAATTAQDIDLLLEVRAALFTKSSRECLDAARDIERVIQKLGRSRYRKEVGLCEKIEPPVAAPSATPAATPSAK